MDNDKKFLATALKLAQKNLGLTAPNPVVGCLIVKDQEILATGITAKNGRPHAEAVAISKADKHKIKGSTLYVTLEPCCHIGQTPACTDQIIKSGIKRVVIACSDIDERVNGNGIKALQAAKIEVSLGLLEKEAQEINKAFFKAKNTGLPYVSIKIASSLDAKIATSNYDSKWITSENARRFAHYLRSVNDAIMVGANTVRYDDPMLDCRLEGLEEYSPKRFVISTKIDFNLQAKIFQTANKIPTFLLTAYKDDYVCNKIRKLGVEIIFCQEKNQQIDLKDALQKLCATGVNSILVEGGNKLITQLLQQKLADELIWIKNARIIGGDGICAIGALGFNNINQTLHDFAQSDLQQLGAEDLAIFYRKRIN